MVKDKHYHDVHSECLYSMRLRPQRSEPERLGIRFEKHARMRLEGQHRGGDVQRMRLVDSRLDHCLVTEMNSIEIADRYGCAARIRWKARGMAKNAQTGQSAGLGITGQPSDWDNRWIDR